jgi:hypothetical protein
MTTTQIIGRWWVLYRNGQNPINGIDWRYLMEQVNILTIALAAQSLISMGCILFGVYLGYRIADSRLHETVKFKETDMGDKGALDTEDIFTENLNIEGIEDLDARLRTL